jgi:hypothetical protein
MKVQPATLTIGGRPLRSRHPGPGKFGFPELMRHAPNALRSPASWTGALAICLLLASGATRADVNWTASAAPDGRFTLQWDSRGALEQASAADGPGKVPYYLGMRYCGNGKRPA